MNQISEKFIEQFFKTPKWIVVLFSWIVAIGLIFGFLWINEHFLHIPLGSDSECSGTFESSCGSSENLRIDNY